MVIIFIFVVLCYLSGSSSSLSIQTRANSCDSYNHPQYGIGQCIETSKCPNGLYVSGYCESLPANVKCCFSLNQTTREEFRAIWIATAANIDWPSSKTATPATQQNEIINILNMVERLNMNAVIFQVSKR